MFLSQGSTPQPASIVKASGEGVELAWGFKIPMRDGIRLNGTVYRPKDVKKRLPVIFTLTPYTADSYHDRALYFAQNGYVFVLVDTRGRGNSEGIFDPMSPNDGLDGYDTVEWLARSSWSNGRVAMWGGSYAGFDQWATLKEFPPHLVTIVPAAAACPGVDFPDLKGISYPYLMQWLTLTSGVTGNQKIFGEAKFWIQKFQELYLKHIPFKDLDKIVGNPSTLFQQWLEHPRGDPYWEKIVPTADQYREIDIPILTITGHYDEEQYGAMHYYHMHMRHGSIKARASHYLIVGPWDHAGTRTPTKEFGGLKFSDASMVDLNKLHKEWYDWTLKEGKKPTFLKKRIACYVMGSDEWKYANQLDELSKTRLKLYLDSSDGIANDVFHSGTLSEVKPTQRSPDKYTYDPLDVRPAEMEREEIKDYLIDQRYALNLFGNGLVYHTKPLAEAMEITGYARLIAWISIDVPDTDFLVTLHEVLQNGNCVMLTYDLIRARYRQSLTQQELAEPGRIDRYDFNKFNIFSRRVAKNSRLRLLIRSPNSIYWQKNYNSGGTVAEESKKEARTAHVTVYHDTHRLSLLELPATTSV